jgi:hypothetical protein
MTYNKPSITALASALCAVQSTQFEKQFGDNGSLEWTMVGAYEVDE